MAVTRAFTTSQLDSRVDFYYTATSGQTTFSGSDDNGSTLSYTASGKKDVYLNGTLLIESDDYVATNGTSVVLQATTQAGDILHISVNKVMSNLVNIVDTSVDLNGNELILDADGDTSITADTDDQIDFKTGGTDRVHIDSSGNVGIGTNSPDGKLHVETASSGATADTSADELVLEGTGNMGMSFLTSTTGANRIYFGDSDDPVSGVIKYDNNNDNMTFDTNGLERIRIDSSGNVGIGTSSPDAALTIQATGASDITYKYTDGNTKAFSKFDNSDFIFKQGTVGNDSYAFFTNNTEHERITPAGKHLFGSTSVEGTASDNMQISSDGGNIYMYQNTTALQGVIDFRNPNGYIGSIRTTGSSTQFNTSSDYRLKENVNYTFDATTELKRLKPCKFNFIADADTTLEGFLAHEVADVVPHAVSGEKDATKQQEIYDDNNLVTGTETVPDYQQIDQSKLVPLLVKTIQELEARITALENN